MSSRPGLRIENNGDVHTSARIKWLLGEYLIRALVSLTWGLLLYVDQRFFGYVYGWWGKWVTEEKPVKTENVRAEAWCI